MKKYVLFLGLLMLIVATAFAPMWEAGEVDQARILVLAGMVLSLVFSFFPGLNTKYAALPENKKKWIMVILCFMVAGGLFAGVCFGLITATNLVCDANSAIELLYMFMLVVIGNQGMFKITPKLPSVKAAAID